MRKLLELFLGLIPRRFESSRPPAMGMEGSLGFARDDRFHDPSDRGGLLRKNLSSLIWASLILLLIQSRLENLSWGLPYPMHPDERNMVDAVSRLSCDDPTEFISGLAHNLPLFSKVFILGQPIYTVSSDFVKVSCANPKFFAYGQFTLYLAYFLSQVIQYIINILNPDNGLYLSRNISFEAIAVSLRLISSLSSIATVFVSLAIWRKIYAKTRKNQIMEYMLFLFLTYTPILIQFAHFGTTESILALFFVTTIYFAVCAMNARSSIEYFQNIMISTLFVGMAIASKVSSLMFLSIPLFVLCVMYGSSILKMLLSQFENIVHGIRENSGLPEIDILRHFLRSLKNGFIIPIIFGFSIASIGAFALFISGVFSPHNVISYPEFLGSMNYESDVGMGRYVAFYTRQFLYELPLIFHIESVFPYALGWVMSILSVIGLVFSPWKKNQNLLRFSLIIVCVLTMPWYAKWARFLSPMYPILVVFSTMGARILLQRIASIQNCKFVTQVSMTFLVVSSIAFGVGYLSVYTSKDVRYVASKWVYDNVAKDAVVLSETANVIDIPIDDSLSGVIRPKDFSINYISFDYYQLDENDKVYSEYLEYLKHADYIFVPSRRVFYNHTCVDVETGVVISNRHSDTKCQLLAQSYPRLKDHYEKLFSGKLGFRKVAEFHSFPRIQILGKTIWEFPDEEAEETMTVFDHPVVRIYKKSIK